MPKPHCLLYRTDSGTEPEHINFSDVSDHVGQSEKFIWLDMEGDDAKQIAKLGEELGLHQLALEDALTTHQRPKLEEYASHLFISAKTAELWEGRVHFGEVHFFIGSNYLVAIRHGRGLAFGRMHDRLRDPQRNIRPGAPLALYLVLDIIADHFRPVVESMSDRFHTLENVLLTDALDRDDLHKLYNVKRELSLLHDAAEPMQAIVLDLIRLHPKLVTPELKVFYRDVHDHAIRVTSALDMLRSNTSDAMQFHLASLTLRQNEAVQKLAGWGAILAVPTVVFSLYGMNFEWMPELKLPWMYPLVVAATAATSIWLYRRLRNRNWI